MIYSVLDIFFVIFHTVLILFNIAGWIWKRTRKANLITLLLTGASWFILGIFYGIGYCPLTDWHFDVLEKLGRTGMPSSYTEYLLERIFRMDFRASFVDKLTALSLFLALILSIVLNIRDRKKKRGR